MIDVLGSCKYNGSQTHRTLHEAVIKSESVRPKCSNALTVSHVVRYTASVINGLCSTQVTFDMEQHKLSESQELFELLTSPHIHVRHNTNKILNTLSQSLIQTHDEVANKDHFYSDVKVEEDEQQMQYVRINKGTQPLVSRCLKTKSKAEWFVRGRSQTGFGHA